MIDTARPPPLPSNTASNPDNEPRYRYPSPCADYAQAPPVVTLEKPRILWLPQIYVEKTVAPFEGEDDSGKWERLAPESDGGEMAYRNGKWVQEGPETFRWVI